MARSAGGDGWSRLVGLLKVVLPLAALGALSTLFLLSDRINPEDALPFAEVDVEERLREPRMTRPAYAGMTEDGSAIEVTAGEARPAQEGVKGQSAADVTGVMTTPDGVVTHLVADAANLPQDQSEVVFTGNVVLDHETGYRVRTEEMIANLQRTDVRSDLPVVADGPVGQITADRMRLTQDGAGGGGYLLVFNGNVKLIYQPPK
ncbi:LPS export ABC transporter periplasmic protein LptC [Tabrizicola sp. TH137]|uniref:LPS export ABC transporter periplasmic protein LptC n=1 Tax=Tabrizicola sp. TH137 TaxID=2067452 RepID=UPI000C7A5515|nr:LPS export ABC transporter periplasmic protein LptC [Tabrizicola sp. TH137]PLL14796.1 LPS export ABC transporter periplasmic protein LptC [Tabrizicola sp. TH137]